MTRIPVQYAYMRLGLGKSQDEWLTDTIWVDAPQESGQWGELCAWADVVAHDHFKSMGHPDCVYGFLDYVAGVSAFGNGPHDDGTYDFERDGGRMALGKKAVRKHADDRLAQSWRIYDAVVDFVYAENDMYSHERLSDALSALDDAAHRYVSWLDDASAVELDGMYRDVVACAERLVNMGAPHSPELIASAVIDIHMDNMYAAPGQMRLSGRGGRRRHVRANAGDKRQYGDVVVRFWRERRAGAFAPEEVVENLARDITHMIQNGEFELFDKASGWDDDNLRDVGFHAIDRDIDEYGSYDETDLLDRAILRIDRSTLKVSMTVAPDDVIDIFVDEAEYRIRNGIVHLVDDGRGWTEPALREIVYDIWDEDADFYDGSGYDAEDIVSRSVDALLDVMGSSAKGAMAAKHHKSASAYGSAQEFVDEIEDRIYAGDYDFHGLDFRSELSVYHAVDAYLKQRIGQSEEIIYGVTLDIGQDYDSEIVHFMGWELGDYVADDSSYEELERFKSNPYSLSDIVDWFYNDSKAYEVLVSEVEHEILHDAEYGNLGDFVGRSHNSSNAYHEKERPKVTMKAGKFVGAVQWEADEGYSGNPTARISNYAVVVMTPDDTGDGTWGYQVFDEEDDDAMRYGYAFRIQYGFESEREVKEFVDKVLLLP